MRKNRKAGGIWIFGDYRNYFQNRVTLQLISKGKEIAQKLKEEVAVIVMGERIHQYAMEYTAHGADIIIAAEHPDLVNYRVDVYTTLLARWVEAFEPDIFLAGATALGRELFPRLAKKLNTGLSADCIALEVDVKRGLLVQTTPAFGGELLADVVTPDRRPQMATVHPGVFKERPHNQGAVARMIYPEIQNLPTSNVTLLRSRRQTKEKIKLENAPVVIAGGRGMGAKETFDFLYELAELLEGEVGATRPAIRAGWAGEEQLLGQTGKSVKPKLLISAGTSGALQFITGIQGSETIIAINRDPHAPIFRVADLGLVGDAKAILPLLIESLRKRL